MQCKTKTVLSWMRLTDYIVHYNIKSHLWLSICVKSLWETIGHFRITSGLFFKASPGAHLFIWKLVFIHMQMKTNFHMKGWAPGLALKKKRPRVIRKWLISIQDLYFRVHDGFDGLTIKFQYRWSLEWLAPRGRGTEKFNTGRLRPEVRPLTPLYTIFGRKDTPFVYLPLTNGTSFEYFS